MSRTRVVVATLAAMFIAGAATDTGPLLLGNREAHAVVGRPLTPVSYAGVARRTTRRTVRRAARAGYITALPPGCVFAGGIYACGAVRYQPYYDGPNLVYVEVQ